MAPATRRRDRILDGDHDALAPYVRERLNQRRAMIADLVGDGRRS
jgi:hypothetical protein